MKKIFLYLFLLIASFTLSTSAKGQCPADGWQGCLWTGEFTINLILSNGCQVQVYYCLGCADGELPKIWISGVRPFTVECDPMDARVLINEASQALLNDPTVAAQIGIPTCTKNPGFQGKTTQLFVGLCFKWTYIGWPIGYIYIPCGFDVCKKECKQCILNGVVTTWDCTYTMHGSANCEAAPVTWQLDECYNILPCGQQ